jgi:hypothetical protein
MTIRPTSDRAAVVDTEFHWLDAKQYQPPLSKKILCINKQQGVAIISHWVSAFGFTHWAPLPTFKKEEKP